MQAVSILLFAFSVLVVAASTDHFTRVKRRISVLTDAIVERHKRQLDLSSRSCSKQCQETLVENIRNKNGTEYDGFDSPFALLKDGFDNAGIESICEYATYDLIKAADSLSTRSVVAGSMKKANIASLSASDLPVLWAITSSSATTSENEKNLDFIAHLPCYRQAKNRVKNICFKTCSNPAFIKALASAKNSAFSNTTADILKQIDALQPMCKFTNCALKCAHHIFYKQCTDDPKAGPFFRDVGVAGQETMLSEMEALDTALGTNLMPDECLASISPNACPCPTLGNLMVRAPKPAKGAPVYLMNARVDFSDDVDTNNCPTSINCIIPGGPPTLVFSDASAINPRSVVGQMSQPLVQPVVCDKASSTWMLPAAKLNYNQLQQPFIQFACFTVYMQIEYLFPSAEPLE